MVQVLADESLAARETAGALNVVNVREPMTVSATSQPCTEATEPASTRRV